MMRRLHHHGNCRMKRGRVEDAEVAFVKNKKCFQKNTRTDDRKREEEFLSTEILFQVIRSLIIILLFLRSFRDSLSVLIIYS